MRILTRAAIGPLLALACALAAGACDDRAALPTIPCPPGTRREAGTCVQERPPADAVGHLTISVRTGDGPGDGADGHLAELCLTSDLCVPLDLPNADVLRPGLTDVFHVERLGLPRSALDRVTLRSTKGSDGWRPACVAVAIDGAIVHCEDRLDVVLGTEGDASRTWTDPEGIHLACGSCATDPVTHGPLVGAVGPDRARILLRTDAAREVTLLVHDEEAPGAPVVAATATSSPADDFTVVIDVDGLAPSRRYRAFVDVDGGPSTAEARFRTAPPAGVPTTLRLGFGSCARITPQPIFDVVRREEPDVFLFGGDNHYADSARLDALWGHLRAGLEHPARAAVVASTPTLAIWDDHDFVGNDSNGTWAGKETALRAFEDYWANPSLGLPGVPGVFSMFAWGDVELFLLDVRMHRSPDDDAFGGMLGEAQTAWLEERLAASRATFKVLVSGTIWSPGAGETWLDHPGARARLFDFLRARSIEGVVLLAGDLHRSMLRRIPREGAYALPEIIASPLATPKTWRCPPPSPEVEEIACFDAGNSVAILDFDTTVADPQLRVRILDEAGHEAARMDVRRTQLR